LVLNYIWIAFFLIAFVVGLIKLIAFNDVNVFPSIVQATFDMAKFSVIDLALPLAGIMTLWLGLMNIGEKAGAISFLSRIVGPFFGRLFPEVPRNHPANGHIIMNFSANMLGLDNAATPLGLKAMQSLQELNPKKDTASNAQIMFLVLNTSGLTLIPISIMAQRAIVNADDPAMKAANPTDVFIPILLATFASTLIGLIYVAIRQRINLLQPVILLWLLGITGIVILTGWYFSGLPPSELEAQSKIVSTVIIFSIIIIFVSGAMVRRINAFEAFIEGAKGGFETAVKIIPYLVAMLVGIAVFRASGAMDYVILFFTDLARIPKEVADALPTALMKPLSGSGSRGMMIEAMKTFGSDSFTARLACTFQGAADTTFYIVALYFGTVGVTRTRYAIWGGLIADLAGVLAAIYIAYLWWG
jgi:spore maturation protein SpmA